MTISAEDKRELLKYVTHLQVRLSDDLKKINAFESIIVALSYEPCLICKRRVKNPCNTIENYMESGPWDYNCEALIWPERFEE